MSIIEEMENQMAELKQKLSFYQNLYETDEYGKIALSDMKMLESLRNDYPETANIAILIEDAKVRIARKIYQIEHAERISHGRLKGFPG